MERVITDFYEKKINELGEERDKQLKVFRDVMNKVNYDNLAECVNIPFHIDGHTNLTKEEFASYLTDIKEVITWVLRQRYLYENARRPMPASKININPEYIYIANQFTFYLTIEWAKPKLEKYYSYLDLNRFIDIIYSYQELILYENFRDLMVEAMIYGRSHFPRDYPEKNILKKIGWD